MKNQNKKIGLYIRVSSEKQLEEGFSYIAQEERLIDEARREKQDYIVYGDGGVTGTKTDNREGLKQLMKDVELGLISKVYVTKISRLARNSRDLENIIYEFERHNVFFKSISDGIDTSTPMGSVMVKLMGIFAQMERDGIIEQTRTGAEKRAKEGKIYGSGLIFGYDRVPDESAKNKTTRLEINEKEAEVVKIIFSMYLGGYGYKAITNSLNKNGYRTKRKNLFAINTVKTILDNPLYAGYIRYGKYKDWSMKRRKGLASEHILVEGNHNAIVTKSDWDLVQERMKQNQRKKSPTGKYLLAGVLTCPQCGSKMVGSKSKYKTKDKVVERLYYTCSLFHNKGLTACRSNGVRVDLIDPIAIKRVSKKLNSKKLATELHNYITQSTSNSNSSGGRSRVLELEISKQDSRKTELRNLYTDGIISADELREDINKINMKKEEYQKLLDDLKNDECNTESTHINVTLDDVTNFLHGIQNVLQDKNDNSRMLVKNMIRTLVKKIDILDRNKVDMDISIDYENLLYSLLEQPTKTDVESTK